MPPSDYDIEEPLSPPHPTGPKVYLEMEQTEEPVSEPCMDLDEVVPAWSAADDHEELLVAPMVPRPVRYRRLPKAQKRRVSFAALHIREYSQVLGDHPCCTLGPPVSLSWEYKEEKEISLDIYESTRPRRRTRQQLRMSWDRRREILASYSDAEVRRAQRKLFRERNCRDKRQKQFFENPPTQLARASE